MIIAKIRVNGAIAKTVYRKVIPAGIIGAQVELDYDEDIWHGLHKTVVFKGAVTKDVVTDANIVTIPHEVVEKPFFRLSIGVYGVDADGNIAIPTLWEDIGAILDAAAPSGDISTDPSLPVWAQIQAMIGDLSNLTTAQVNALDGMFKVCAFTKDNVSAEYTAFKTAFGIADSGGGGGDPDVPVTPDVTLTSISATYSGGDVAIGTALTALTGITVTATYSDGSTAVVTGYTLSGTIAEGNNTITVSYGGKTTTITVTGVVEQGGGEETGVSNETTWTDRVAYTYNAVENEYVEANGTITSYAGWNRTPYLYCAGASTLRVIVNISTSILGTNNCYNCFYDENKNFISQFDYSGIDSNIVGAYKDFVVPENAAYFIASHKAKAIGEPNSTIAALGFVPYGQKAVIT